MQTNQTTVLRPTDKGYVPIVEQACNKITGLSELYKEMERSISISGKSKSTLVNYGRQLATWPFIMIASLLTLTQSR